MSKHPTPANAEAQRLREDAARERNWKRWGTYLSERQWGTVREDYSEDGNCWDYFTHDQARSRAYRWGEDGLLGFSDRQCRLCFSLALWNGRDRFLKERLFGLTNPQGNHSEDVKECYYYLRATPTHSYQKALYKYPQLRFPYEELIQENGKRSRLESEYELADTGVFDDNNYYDVTVEYAKASPDDILINITIANRSKLPAQLHLLPQIWFRNTWSFGGKHLSGSNKPSMWREGPDRIQLMRETLGEFCLDFDRDIRRRGFLFTENATNHKRLFNIDSEEKYVKDAFHDYVVGRNTNAVSPHQRGTKASGHYVLNLVGGEETRVRLRLRPLSQSHMPAFDDFDFILRQRIAECEEFYRDVIPAGTDAEAVEISRQAYAGLIWTKQFYSYAVDDWLRGDARLPLPPHAQIHRRNGEWRHLFARDIISMPDKWEYPWFAAWDLAFHMVPFANVDAVFAKHQLELLLREWYMHPNGQIPAYEFAFGDVNPPVHAWAAWRVYEIDKKQRGKGDRKFLAGVFHKLLMNFTWWVNQKDEKGRGIFSGGFLGLDNIGIFDRGAPLPTGGSLEQADATSWMAFYCLCMLRMALELSMRKGKVQTPYEDMASKFLEHFVQIADAINTHGGTGLWHEPDGFYYDQVRKDNETIILKTRSLVGLLPLIAVAHLREEEVSQLPGFSKRFAWFRNYRPDLSRHIVPGERGGWLLAIPSRERLIRMLRHMLDENEFLSPHGIRSLSRYHQEHPFTLRVDEREYKIQYTPGEAETDMFGGNSNWRGPVWFPINHLLIESLERYHGFFGPNFRVEYPTHSGKDLSLHDVASELMRRHGALFRKDKSGQRPCHGGDERYAADPHWKELLQFHEFFHGDNGKGLGASHQTGWTALVTMHLEELARRELT